MGDTNYPTIDIERIWICEFGTRVSGPDENGDCEGCNGRQDLRGCGWRWLLELPSGWVLRQEPCAICGGTGIRRRFYCTDYEEYVDDGSHRCKDGHHEKGFDTPCPACFGAGGHPVLYRPCDTCGGTGTETWGGATEGEWLEGTRGQECSAGCVGGMVPAGTIETRCKEHIPGKQDCPRCYRVLVIPIDTKETA